MMRLHLKYISLICVLLIIVFIIFLFFRKGVTMEITDMNGNKISESIAKLEKVKLGNMEQWILIRGNNISNPILLWLHGGPGSSQMPLAHYLDKELEKEFVVVHWDQRGAGKSNSFDFDEKTMTFDQFLSDAHKLTKYLKNNYRKEKIYILGHSWGSQLGLNLVTNYPQDYHAYIGVSQFVNHELSNKISYQWIKQKVNNIKHKEKLDKLGSPPYINHKKYIQFIQLIDTYGGGFDVDFNKLLWISFTSSEYNMKDYILWFIGSNRGSGPMWNTQEYRQFNALEQYTNVNVPVYLLNGRKDYNTPLKLTRMYFNKLKCNKGKQLIIFENSSHTPFLCEREKFINEIIRVKKETYN